MLAILTCFWASCSDGGSEDPVNPTPKPEEVKAEITIDSNIVSNGLSFGVASGEQTVSFSVNTNWTLSVASTTSGATWCKASTTSGSKGTANVKFTVDENTGYDDRSVSVTIKAGSVSKTFTITQKGVDTLLVTTNKYEVAQEGGRIEVEVKANINYELAISETAKDWITESKSKSRALSTYKHTFEIAASEEVEKREGEITFKSGDKVETVKVYQAGGTILLLSQNEFIVSDAGETISVNIKSNIEYGVQMPDVDWITDEASSRGMSSHTLKYVIAPNENYDSRSENIIFYDKNSDLKDTITISQQGKAFETDYVDLRFDDPNVTTTYNATDGSLTVTYPSDNLPTIKAGNSIVLPAEYGFDIRVIESVSTSGNSLNLTTTQGNMTNLFRNISFTLTSNPSISGRSANGDRVYTPTAYGYIDENGKYYELYNETTATRASLLIEQNLWDFNENFHGEEIYSGEAGTLSWETCEFYAGLKGTFTFDFGEKEIDDKLPIGDLKKFSYELTGNVGMDLKLKYDYSYEYEESDDQIFKYNVIPTGVLRFTVGAVPVVILVYTHLGKQYACQIGGELETTTGVKMENEVSIGLEWTPDGGVTPTRKITPTLELYPLTIEAKASAEAKVSYYPQVEIGIYKFIGPWFEPRPYLKETVGAGFGASTNGENYVGWKAETYNGMDFRMGLKMDFGFWDKDVWTSEIDSCIKERMLFEAPSRIRALSPENNIKVGDGESVTAEFIAESFSPLTNQYYPCPFALVNFEPECGTLEKSIALTDIDGKISVIWTPKNSKQSRATEMVNKKLVAKVVDGEGEAISETVLIVRIENNEGNNEEDNDEEEQKKLIKPVDLGLSVKWASSNLGAKTSKDYGVYYAFGEVSPKSEYEWENWDNPKILKLSGKNDAATHQFGSGWRMPTKSECEELLKECTWKLVDKDDIKGYEVTGKNGNSIFLPLTGSPGGKEEGKNYEARYRTSEAELDGAGYEDPSTIVMKLQLKFSESKMDYAGGWKGHPIRPVLMKIVGKWIDRCEPPCYYVFEGNGTGTCYDGSEVDRIKWKSSENKLFLTKTTPAGIIEEEELDIEWIDANEIKITKNRVGYDGSQTYYRINQ